MESMEVDNAVDKAKTEDNNTAESNEIAKEHVKDASAAKNGRKTI